ncbi:hypothetical protein [Terrarubrum flagellatum]|uniref:hypothetical protein n=1 Tax=Terrirubrum flagellatum TaxID=2895980 RepID=UPI0031453301
MKKPADLDIETLPPVLRKALRKLIRSAAQSEADKAYRMRQSKRMTVLRGARKRAK